jgi:hypothetical protein
VPKRTLPIKMVSKPLHKVLQAEFNFHGRITISCPGLHFAELDIKKCILQSSVLLWAAFD